MVPELTRVPSFRLSLVVLGIFLLPSGALIFARLKGESVQPAPSTQTRASDVLEVEPITLRPYGFEPAEVTRPKGPFVLFVEDRSGRSNTSLNLRRLKGDQLRDVNTSRMKSEWHDVLNLPAGDYILIDGSNAEARCQITILP